MASYAFLVRRLNMPATTANKSGARITRTIMQTLSKRLTPRKARSCAYFSGKRDLYFIRIRTQPARDLIRKHNRRSTIDAAQSKQHNRRSTTGAAQPARDLIKKPRTPFRSHVQTKGVIQKQERGRFPVTLVT